jgi:hypothetical protein
VVAPAHPALSHCAAPWPCILESRQYMWGMKERHNPANDEFIRKYLGKIHLSFILITENEGRKTNSVFVFKSTLLFHIF